MQDFLFPLEFLRFYLFRCQLAVLVIHRFKNLRFEIQFTETQAVLRKIFSIVL